MNKPSISYRVGLIDRLKDEKYFDLFLKEIRADQTRIILELLRKDDDSQMYGNEFADWLEEKLGEMK